jgi:hypothetical protein
MTELTETAFNKARELMRAEQERNPILDTADAYRAALARLLQGQEMWLCEPKIVWVNDSWRIERGNR